MLAVITQRRDKQIQTVDFENACVRRCVLRLVSQVNKRHFLCSVLIRLYKKYIMIYYNYYKYIFYDFECIIPILNNIIILMNKA